MKNKKIIKTLIITITLIMFLGIKNIYATEGTVRMQINNGTAWTNINISESYEACENLNKPTSTLGTTLLEAHLTTDEDWSAMAVFSVSQYGASTSNAPSTTTGNLSGIYNAGRNKTQSTGLSATAKSTTNVYVKGLFNEDGTTKKYIKTWDLNNREGNDYIGFKTTNGTYGWMGGWTFWDKNQGYPISIHQGLFGVAFGHNYHGVATGGSLSDVTFRPVIWN